MGQRSRLTVSKRSAARPAFQRDSPVSVPMKKRETRKAAPASTKREIWKYRMGHLGAGNDGSVRGKAVGFSRKTFLLALPPYGANTQVHGRSGVGACGASRGGAKK